VTDIFREVEEEVRRERVEKLWKQYGDYAIAGVAVIVLAVGGWQFWKFYHGRELLRASDAYAHASNQASAGDAKGAATEFAKLAKDGPSGYATLARLQQANALMATGSIGDAVKIYREIENGSDPSLAAVARLRHAWAVVDIGAKSDIVQILGPLTDASSEWKYPAREVLAYSDYHNGDTKNAIAEFKKLAADTKAPANLRQRAEIMAQFVAAGAGKDIGTVPPPPMPSPQTPSNNGTPNP
jgi:hypothetical protein